MPDPARPRPSFRVRQESNPQNRFESTQVEWEDGVELPQTVRVHKETPILDGIVDSVSVELRRDRKGRSKRNTRRRP